MAPTGQRERAEPLVSVDGLAVLADDRPESARRRPGWLLLAASRSEPSPTPQPGHQLPTRRRSATLPLEARCGRPHGRSPRFRLGTGPHSRPRLAASASHRDPDQPIGHLPVRPALHPRRASAAIPRGKRVRRSVFQRGHVGRKTPDASVSRWTSGRFGPPPRASGFGGGSVSNVEPQPDGRRC